MSAPYKALPLTDFPLLESSSTEVSSVAVGGRILSCSDEWFAPASDLLKVEPAVSMKGQFGPKGALFTGWETRRHNPEWTDWVIMRLGPAGGATIVGFDVDTAHFNGNEAPEVEVFGFRMDPSEEASGSVILPTDQRWQTLLPRVPCGPSQRHLFSVPESSTVTHIKLHMIPDGGIARFKVYGRIPPPPVGLGVSEVPASDTRLNALDLAHSMNGGRVIFTSDQHFGKGPNVILPGRGHDMGDGWETKRSRTPGHRDWLVIQLGEPGLLDYAEIDTAHFLGNFPESVELHGIMHEGAGFPAGTESSEAASNWTHLLPRQKTGPGQQHFFKLANAEGKPFSHIRVTMHPDGGIKRVRIVGRRAAALQGFQGALPSLQLPTATPAPFVSRIPAKTTSDLPVVAAVPLTSAGFDVYGRVIAGPSGDTGMTGAMLVNQGTARKYAFLGEVQQTFAVQDQAKTNMHIYRCDSTPLEALPMPLKMLERHRFSSQSFVPLVSPGHDGAYLVVVALNGADDTPDLSTLKVFRATGSQAFVYHPGVWHLPMTPIGPGGPLDFACIVAESETDSKLNCDEHWWDRGQEKVLVGLRGEARL